MALIRIAKNDWALVDGDGLTVRMSDLKDAEAIATIIGDAGERVNDAGWIDIAQAIFEAIDEYRVELERLPK